MRLHLQIETQRASHYDALKLSGIGYTPTRYMAKARTQFLCNTCGSVHPKWLGKCPDCGTWDSLEEYKPPAADDAQPACKTWAPMRLLVISRAAGNRSRISNIDQAESPRLPTGIGEFDRILGGGVVPGSAVLVGGEPGIGKSTLLLQVAQSLSDRKRLQSALCHQRRIRPAGGDACGPLGCR